MMRGGRSFQESFPSDYRLPRPLPRPIPTTDLVSKPLFQPNTSPTPTPTSTPNANILMPFPGSAGAAPSGELKQTQTGVGSSPYPYLNA